MIFRDIVGSERKEAEKYFSKTNGKGLSKHCVSTARSFLSERFSVYPVALPFNFERQIWETRDIPLKRQENHDFVCVSFDILLVVRVVLNRYEMITNCFKNIN